MESVTKTAEAMHLTQPAVSIQLKNLQKQFDLPLFEVMNRRVYITDFGKEVAETANQILEKVDWINQRVYENRGVLIGKLKIAVVSTGKYVMPYFLQDFMHAHEQVELTMDVTNKERVIESLEANEVDFALVSITPESLKVDKLDLMPNLLYLVAHKSYQFDQLHTTSDKLSIAPLIYREQGSGTRQAMERFIKKANVKVPSRLELTSNEAVKQAVLAGLGISIMPVIGLKNELGSGEVQVVHLKGLPVTTKWSLIWQKGKKHGPIANTFLQDLTKNKAQIIQKNFGWYQDFQLLADKLKG